MNEVLADYLAGICTSNRWVCHEGSRRCSFGEPTAGRLPAMPISRMAITVPTRPGGRYSDSRALSGSRHASGGNVEFRGGSQGGRRMPGHPCVILDPVPTEDEWTASGGPCRLVDIPHQPPRELPPRYEPPRYEPPQLCCARGQLLSPRDRTHPHPLCAGMARSGWPLLARDRRLFLGRTPFFLRLYGSSSASQWLRTPERICKLVRPDLSGRRRPVTGLLWRRRGRHNHYQ